MINRRSTKALSISGTRLILDGKPFYFQGLSFFNALYNPAFNKNADERLSWLSKFKDNGINALRVFCEWNFVVPLRPYIDMTADTVLYTNGGDIRQEHFARLDELIRAADQLGMVIQVVLFAQERQPYFMSPEAQDRAARQMTEMLKPYGNIILQIWNECSLRVRHYYEICKAADPDRIVTSSPGLFNEKGVRFDRLGDDEDNRALDMLTPHTLRSDAEIFWYTAPGQIAYLLDTYRKPVIDDEPARDGPVQFGGIPGGTKPEWHVEQIKRVRALGAYHTFHHDMFQYGYGNPLTSPSGIPDPDFSPIHRKVFDFLRDHTTW